MTRRKPVRRPAELEVASELPDPTAHGTGVNGTRILGIDPGLGTTG
ncbi:MAG: hypothetical protein Q4C47_04460 [Planctomycetia bacterium]|nr:hypothetical protein [Planctomycetia bacterium]